MSIVSLIDASKDFGDISLFRNLDLYINKGERLGLIGPNGSGKSTLLKILAGEEPLRSGIRNCSTKVSMEFVGQDSYLKKGKTVIEEVLAGCGEKRELLIRFNLLSEKIAKNPSGKELFEELGRLSERMDFANAWSLEQECKEVLFRLGITDLNKPVEELSGGYRKRVNLASALVSKPDLLLLDEPTNHLDAIGVEWLQSWFMQFKGALVLVTHDRYFLDQITMKMIEVNRGTVRTYEGNYSTFLESKSNQEILQASSEEKFKGILRRELAWLKQGPKGRGTKQKARIKKIEGMRNKAIQAEMASIEMFNSSKRIGKFVAEAKSLIASSSGRSDGPLLFKNFSYEFNSNDRVGIIGCNGSGKSTLLDLISGRQKPIGGEIRIGETIQIGYLDQHTNDLLEGRGGNRKVIDFIKEIASYIKIGKEQISASQLLERFLFPPSQQHIPINKLSGGEKRRLTLCRILIQEPNLLLLDEPTNDLDIQTLSIIEDFLDKFQGCVIIVSHDRYFLDRTVTNILSIEEGLIHKFQGNYSEFLNQNKFQVQKIAKINKANDGKPKPPKNNVLKPNLIESKRNIKARRRSFKEAKELEALDKDIPILESRKRSLEKKLTGSNKDLVQASKDFADLLGQIKEAEDRWLELSELEP